MKTKLHIIAAAAAALMAAPIAGAHIISPDCNSKMAPRAELRCAQHNRQHALATIGWARNQQLARALSIEPSHLSRIVRDHRWLYRVMSARVLEAERRIEAASWPAHHLLWLCIHSHEGAWDDPNSGGNGHYGGLQMHPGWGYGTSYHASDDTQLVQEQSAERAYHASGYSSHWLTTQWGQTIGSCWGYA